MGMTTNEAIEILRKNRPTSDPRPCGMELCDAVDMAISALRQQDVADKDVGKNEPLTNAQKIRSMTDEELVNLHYSGSAHCIASDPTVCDRHDFIGNLTPCEQCYLKWLQQPAEDDHDERKENENV